ncbi:MAG: metallophosphoesterase [Clostridia bacterium]|nr:metallophosphoesterase [Clostridia bacterium]
MRIALIADIHANLPALEAVLLAIRQKHKPDMILSLGDQINLGPCPRETLALLRDHHVVCLHGNHEGYVLAAMKGDPAYDGANFSAVRWNAHRLSEAEITFPQTYELGGVTFCHAMPGNDRFPVHDVHKALPLLQKMTFDRPTHIICGHGHNPSHYRVGNLTLDCIGSVGCMDDAPPGIAPYVLLTIDRFGAALEPFFAGYDVCALKPLFLSSGMAESCPVMSHLISLQMTTNHDYLLPFVQLAWSLARSRRQDMISEDVWQETDRIFAWPDGVSTHSYWR